MIIGEVGNALDDAAAEAEERITATADRGLADGGSAAGAAPAVEGGHADAGLEEIDAAAT